MRMAQFGFRFEYDDGYGGLWPCRAVVSINQGSTELEAVIDELDIDSIRDDGDEPYQRVVTCCEEEAEEIAWQKWEEMKK